MSRLKLNGAAVAAVAKATKIVSVKRIELRVN